MATNARTGVYRRVRLGTGENVVVKYDQSGLLTIEILKLMGFSSERIFACDVESPQGREVVAWLTRGAEPGSAAATPLGAAVAFVRESESLAELKRSCAVLMSGP